MGSQPAQTKLQAHNASLSSGRLKRENMWSTSSGGRQDMVGGRGRVATLLPPQGEKNVALSDSVASGYTAPLGVQSATTALQCDWCLTNMTTHRGRRWDWLESGHCYVVRTYSGRTYSLPPAACALKWVSPLHLWTGSPFSETRISWDLKHSV